MTRTSYMRAAKSGVLSLFGLLMSCSQAGEAADAFIADLGNASQKLQAGQELRMETINKGAWNRVFIFAPYTPLSEIEGAIKIKPSSAIESARVSERDDINLLVFLNGESIQVVAAVPRRVVDLSVTKEVQPLTRGTAVFKNVGAGRPLVWAGSK